MGDAVAIVAGEDEKAVNKAMKLIKVKYQKLPAILDFRKSKDNEILIHPEENWKSLCPVGADNRRNLCGNLSDLQLYGCFRKIECCVLDADSVPCKKNSFQCP